MFLMCSMKPLCETIVKTKFILPRSTKNNNKILRKIFQLLRINLLRELCRAHALCSRKDYRAPRISTAKQASLRAAQDHILRID